MLKLGLLWDRDMKAGTKLALTGAIACLPRLSKQGLEQLSSSCFPAYCLLAPLTSSCSLTWAVHSGLTSPFHLCHTLTPAGTHAPFYPYAHPFLVVHFDPGWTLITVEAMP
jgi:hypothetical protein